MQEKAAQLRQELDAASKGDRHAQFKWSASKTAGGSGGGPGGGWGGAVGAGQAAASALAQTSSPSRRFLRTVTAHSAHSVSTIVPHNAPTAHGPAAGHGPRGVASIASAAMAAAAAAAASAGIPGGGSTAGGIGSGSTSGGGGLLDRQPSAAPSRISSRRASTGSGAETDASGNEPRTSTNGYKTSPSRRTARATRAAFREVQDYAAAISRQNQLEDMVAELEGRVRELSADNERRQDSYMRRETELQVEVARLTEALRKARGEGTTASGGEGQGQGEAADTGATVAAKAASLDRAAANIRELHTQVVSQIEDLLTAQAASLRAEENSTLRRFTNRLTELESAVMAERARGQSREELEAAERIKKLSRERDNMQDIATILDKKHSLMAEENARLRAQFKLQEEDRDYLVKQTVALKKENQALRNQLAALMQDLAVATDERDDMQQALAAAEAAAAAVGGSGAAPASGGGGGGGYGAVSRPVSARAGGAGTGVAMVGGSGPEAQLAVKLQRYEDVIESLKRLLEAERRRTKQARAAHTLELQQRTGLQGILRQCVEDVREKRRALEADSQRQRNASDRTAARSRPISALRPPPSASPVSRPVSAAMLLPSHRRPASAGADGGGGGSSFSSSSSFTTAQQQQQGGQYTQQAQQWPPVLTPAEREELISTLLGHEEVLRAVFDRAFPGVTPHPPSDPYLDRMAAWQEQRDAQVAANAKVLAAAKNAVLPPATAVKESTPGGMLLKEAANRPWVLNVDAMLADFLGGTVGGGAGGAGPPSSKSTALGSVVPGGSAMLGGAKSLGGGGGTSMASGGALSGAGS